MPIYDVRCSLCGREIQDVVIQPTRHLLCCGMEVEILPTYSIAMTKWKGEGGFPSRRKEILDRKHEMSRHQTPYMVNS